LQTSREDTEAQLRRYTHLFEFAPMGYFKVARDGRTIQQANLAAERLFGLSRSEFLHQPLARFIAEDSRPVINDVLTKVFAQEIGGAPERCEVKMLYREQKPFWVFIEAILNENGQLCRLAVLDITERKQAEAVLQESNQKMQLIFETMSEGVALNEVVYDEAGEMINYRILEVNAAYKTIADYRGEVIIGQLATDLYGLSQQTITDFWMEAQYRTTAKVLEYFSPNRQRWFETTISPVVNNRFVTTVFDITERKRVERQLHDKERFLATIINNVPGMIYSCLNDPDWTMVFVSKGCEGVTGYSEDELINNNVISYGNIVHPEDSDWLWKKCQASLDAHKPCKNEYRIIAKNGETRWVTEQSEGLYAPDGTLLSIDGFIQDITELKESEEALRKSEAVFRSALQSLSEGIVVQDTTAAILLSNPKAEQILGLTTEQMMGRTSLDPRWHSIHEDGSSFPGETHPVPITLRTGVPQHNVIMGVHKSDDTLSWISINAEPIFLEGETELYGAIATFTDISEKKQAEEKLRKTEENQQRILETMGVGVTVTRNGQMLFANESWCKLIGYTAEEIRSFDFYDTIHPVSRQLIRERGLARMRGEDVPDRYETQFCHKNGAILWIDISAFLIEYEGMTAVISTMVDITERKRAESLLASSEERYRLFVELQGTYFLRTDLEGKYTYASPAHTQTFGLGKTSVIGVFGLDHIIPEDHDKTQATVEQCLQSPGTPIPVVLRKPSATGQILWTEWEFIAIQNSEGSVTEIQCVGHDITERKLVEEALHELNQTLEQRVERRTHELVLLNNEKNEFLGIAAHDLKNPLSGILTSAEILERYYGGEVRTKRYLSMIVSASEQMLDIIENLLDVNKIESGHVKVNIAPISLSVVSAVVDDYIQRATSKGIILRYDPVPDESTPTVLADEQALWQVLDNLVSNAVKYSPRWKSISVRTLNRTDAKGKHFGRVEIQDQGPGISEADMHKLFQKFTRLTAQPTAGENSTGLGLSIVKKLVELQQGKVWCESELGKGATFIVEFPSA